MTTMISNRGLRRTTGGLFVAGAVSFAAAATALSSAFDWPDILREPADVVLPAFVAGGPSLVWTWFATAWTYAVLLVPILLLPTVLGRRSDPVLRAATYVGATSVVLSLIGFLRWVFVVPPLADSYVTGDAVTRAAADAAWTAQHQFGGALLGEHLGQLLVIGWSVTLSVVILRSGVLPRWLGVAGLAVSAVYLLNQGDILATAVPGFPAWGPAGLLGSTGWGLWIAALGVVLLRRAVGHGELVEGTADASSASVPAPRSPAPLPSQPATRRRSSTGASGSPAAPRSSRAAGTPSGQRTAGHPLRSPPGGKSLPDDVPFATDHAGIRDWRR